jgi:hypothetical protein
MTYLRERISAKHGPNGNGAEIEYAEMYMAVMASIEQRNGPSAGEINKELLALAGKQDQRKIITLGQ